MPARNNPLILTRLRLFLNLWRKRPQKDMTTKKPWRLEVQFWVPPRRLNPPKKQSMLTRMIQLRIKLTLDQGGQLRPKL